MVSFIFITILINVSDYWCPLRKHSILLTTKKKEKSKGL